MQQALYVGGSLVPHGGHNMLEPAAQGCPVLYGPHLTNFAQEASLLEDAGGQEIESRQSKWRGHPARKLRYSLAGSVAQQVRVRLLLVESRLYLLMARWPLAEAMPPEVERFWASFQVEDP